MNAAQFEALAELLRMRGGASQEAARLVLVEGIAPAEAARRTGPGIGPGRVPQWDGGCGARFGEQTACVAGEEERYVRG